MPVARAAASRSRGWRSGWRRRIARMPRRAVKAEKGRDDAFVVLLAATLPPAEPLVEVVEGAEGVPERGLQPITSFFRSARKCYE